MLRTLPSCNPEQLGHIIPKKIITGKNWFNTNPKFQLIDTLGRGSFATVFSASLVGSSNRDNTMPVVAIKMAIRTKTNQGRMM